VTWQQRGDDIMAGRVQLARQKLKGLRRIPKTMQEENSM
jgi:hypothetical protein